MLDVLISIAAFVVAIGVLVSIHEFGHFWMARKLGVKVLRFSIGFGKPLWSRRGSDGVEYALSAVPLGGYVKMLDEREGPVAPSELGLAFNRQPVWKRTAIVAAGPASNLLLATLLYWIVFMVGVTGLRPLISEPPLNSRGAQAGLHAGDEIVRINSEAVQTWQVLNTELIDRALDSGGVELEIKGADGNTRVRRLDLEGVRMDPECLFDDLGLAPYQPEFPPVISDVMPGEPAAAAGFKAGDRLAAFNGAPAKSYQQWAHWLRGHPGEAVNVDVERGGNRVPLTVIIGRKARCGAEQGWFGAHFEVPAGVRDNLLTEYRLSPGAAIPAAVAQTARYSALTLKMLYRMVLGDVSVKNVSGPIQIAQIAGYTASIGLVSFLSFIAIVSVSLGVLNLLPVPVLDGGHLLYYGVEIVKGSPLSERAQLLGQQIGLTLLIALMGLAFYNDILRLIG